MDVPSQQQDLLIQDVIQAYRAIVRALHTAEIPEWLRLDLSMAQLKALLVLASDGPTTVGGLADALGIGKPAASILVDRLVQLGLVMREEDAHDRRRALTQLSARGTELVTRLRQGGRERLRGWLERMDPDELAVLTRGLRALADVATGEGARTPQAATPPPNRARRERTPSRSPRAGPARVPTRARRPLSPKPPSRRGEPSPSTDRALSSPDARKEL